MRRSSLLVKALVQLLPTPPTLRRLVSSISHTTILHESHYDRQVSILISRKTRLSATRVAQENETRGNYGL